jgi:hypothetical protein
MSSSILSDTQFAALESLGRKFLCGQPLDVEEAIVCDEPGWPVACLLAMNRNELRKLMPLFAGTNVVGRGAGASYSKSRKSLTGIVEGSQWVISTGSGGTTATDAGSSNGSILVPRRFRSTIPLDFALLRRTPGLTYLGWNGSTSHPEAVTLATGDVLVNPYAWFLFVR